MNLQTSAQSRAFKSEIWTLPFAVETTVVLNLVAHTALVLPTCTQAGPELIQFVTSNECTAVIHALALRGSFSERRSVGKKLSSKAHFQVVEPNTANDHAEELESRNGLSCGENPCFRLIYAEHF